MSEREPDLDSAAEEQDFFDAGEQAGDPLGLEGDPLGIASKMAERARRRQSRGVVMLIVFFVFIFVLVWLTFDELVYFFRSSEPIDLGQAETIAVQPLAHNSYLRVTGIARDMCIRADLFSDRVRFLYLLGSEMGGRILIQATDPGGGCPGAVEREFKGRLVDLSRVGRYAAVLAYYREHFPAAPRRGPMYLLEHDTLPRQAWYFPLALFVLLGLAVLNLVILRRRAGALARASGEGEG